MMFETLLRQQGVALESLMINQPTENSKLMDEARAELNAAIDKAIQASKQTANNA